MDAIDEGGYEVVSVLEGGGYWGEVLFVLSGRAGIAVFYLAEGAVDGFGSRVACFANKFVMSHNFFV